MILLDNDICIELLKGNKRILQRRDQYDGSVEYAYDHAELYYGAERLGNLSKIWIQLRTCSIEIVHTDISILKRFGMIKAHLQKQGEPIADADILIASSTFRESR